MISSPILETPIFGRQNKRSAGLLFSHPTGNANVRAAVTGLFEAGLLERFCTTVAAYPGNLWGWLGSSRFGREFERRQYDRRLRYKTMQYPWLELGRMLATRLRLPGLVRQETGRFSIEAVYQAQDRVVADCLRKNPQAFMGAYAYEDGALQTLTAAHDLGLAGIYELPIGYWRSARKLLKKEFDRMPEWSATLTGFGDSESKLARKDAELANAGKIIVASSFTAKTLELYPGKLAPHVIIPYGFPAVPPAAGSRRTPSEIEKSLRLLFVGSLSQRKGIGDLFAAANYLKGAVSLTVIGNKVTHDCPALDRELARHRWIPSLPHEKILREMREHDVLVFPSLFEGFGLVITEAMSQGLPVITTERTAGPDLIEHGENGWLIPAGATERLVQQLEMLIRDPDTVRAAGLSAQKTACARPWTVYGAELARAVTQS